MAANKIGIKHIAQAANVDVSTVSRALSGSLRVNPKTRQHILDIAESLHYRPNELARGLVMGKSQTVGIIVPEISNSFYAGVIMSIEKVVAAAGYSMILGLSHYRDEEERRCIEVFESKMVDGMILFSGSKSGEQSDSPLYRLKIPFVALDYGVNIQGADVVASNHIYGVKLGVDHLVSLGHRRIAFVTDDVTTGERLDAFRLYAGHHHLDIEDFIVRTDVKYEKGGYLAARQLFSAKVKPTAVFCANDFMAIGAMKALDELGLKIPSDASVMGFDDSTMLNYLTCSLTTIRQHKHRLGEEAGRLLIQRMQADDGPSEKDPYVSITIKPDLVVRDSTGPCREGA